MGNGAWVDSVVSSGRKESNSLPLELRKPANQVLDLFEQRKDELAKIGSSVFLVVISHVACGRITDAEIAWLSTQATFDEQMAALDAASDATRKEKTSRDEAWAKTKQIRQEVLKLLGKAAVPFLLSIV